LLTTISFFLLKYLYHCIRQLLFPSRTTFLILKSSVAFNDLYDSKIAPSESENAAPKVDQKPTIVVHSAPAVKRKFRASMVFVMSQAAELKLQQSNTSVLQTAQITTVDNPLARKNSLGAFKVGRQKINRKFATSGDVSLVHRTLASRMVCKLLVFIYYYYFLLLFFLFFFFSFFRFFFFIFQAILLFSIS
jgi:hypothetical protein